MSASQVRVHVDGRALSCPEGQTLAALFIAQDLGAMRRSERRAEPRGLFCGMGVCHDCAVRIDGRSGERACTTVVRDGMVVETGR